MKLEKLLWAACRAVCIANIIQYTWLLYKQWHNPEMWHELRHKLVLLHSDQPQQICWEGLLMHLLSQSSHSAAAGSEVLRNVLHVDFVLYSWWTKDLTSGPQWEVMMSLTLQLQSHEESKESEHVALQRTWTVFLLHKRAEKLQKTLLMEVKNGPREFYFEGCR